MTVADTSFLVALFDADDVRHEKIREEFAKTDPVVIGAEALVETLGVLKVKAGRKRADAVLAALMAQHNVEWATETDPVGTYQIYAKRKALSFVDAAVIQLALRRQEGLLTLDGRQKTEHARLAGPS